MLHFPMGAIRLKTIPSYENYLIHPSSYFQNWHSLLSIIEPTIFLLCIYAHKNTQSNTSNLMDSYIFLWSRAESSHRPFKLFNLKNQQIVK